MGVNNLNSEYNLIKVICIKEYRYYKIGDIFIVKDFNKDFGYIMNFEVYPKTHFIPFYQYRKERINNLLEKL